MGEKPEKWIKHYCSKQRILLVGEGDFSFAASLARAFGSDNCIVATTPDSREIVRMKHSTAKKHLVELKTLGCSVLHGVNIKTMREHSVLKKTKFDRIVFNFPHAGFYYAGECDPRLIKLHKKLVRAFVKSARSMIDELGEIHITHKTGGPYDKWELETLAAAEGLVLVEKAEFSKFDYPGYCNKRGHGKKSNKTFRVGECSTFKFTLANIKVITSLGERLGRVYL